MDATDYFRLRDAAVLAGGQEFHRFLVSQGRYKSPEQEGITLHKMRTAITTMPEEMRAASKAWLEREGMSPGARRPPLGGHLAGAKFSDPDVEPRPLMPARCTGFPGAWPRPC